MIYIKIFMFLLLFSSCQSDTDVKPSEIYYGEDICERCKMIISESEFAAQYRIKNEPARKFDDLGCLVKYMHEQSKNEEELFIFVVDYETKKWINGKGANYVWDGKIKTPMNYGIISFKTIETATKYSEKNEALLIGNYTEVKNFILTE